jgi:multimeric flavodoxin WrbA
MILGLSGSPRAKTTEFVLKKALNKLDSNGFETLFFTVRGKEINFCRHCDYCFDNLTCVFNDDMQALYPLMRKAEAYIFATPVYNGNVSGQIKTVLDRTRALLASDFDVFRGKPGMAIAVGGDRVGGQELAIQQLITFYTINGIDTISGGAFGANLGASFWSKDSMEGIKNDEEGFKSLDKTIKRFIDVLNKKRIK